MVVPSKTPGLRARICLHWLLLLLLVTLVAPPAHAQPSAAASVLTCDEQQHDPISGQIAVLRGCAFPDAGRYATPQATANAFLQAHRTALGLDRAPSGLNVISSRNSLRSSHVLFQQTLHSYPVYGAYVSIHLDARGQVEVLYNRTAAELRLANVTASVTALQAVRLGRAGIQFEAPRASSPAPVLMVLPRDGNVGRLVWRVQVSASEPPGDWEVLVDANNGEIIKRSNRLTFARGQVYDTQPAAGDLASDRNAAPALRAIDLQGLDGSGWLRGQYVDLTTPTGYLPASAFSSAGYFEYDPADPRFAEVMVYYYIDATQRYLQSLGYRDSNTPSNGIRQRVTRASAHWFAADQSFYSASDDALHFGDGGWADAADPDIIVHEYAHALLYDIATHWGGGEMEAIAEGFGDYLAATRFASASADPGCIGEWDSRAYIETAPFCLRRVDRNRQYPADWSGDEHADGEIWSRVLWDVRQAAGVTAGDVLAVESNFYLPPAATMMEAGQALLDADASVYRGRYRAVIEAALQRGGLAPLPSLTLTAPLTREVLIPGALRAIAWEPTASAAFDVDVQWSPNASAVGERRYPFDGNRLPDAFASSGAVSWRVSNGALRSGAIDHGQTSRVALTLHSLQDSRVSFRYRVDSEAGYDLLTLTIDGQPVLRASGSTSWTDWDMALAPGPHEMVWSYRKDRTVKMGDDAAWIDALVLVNISLADWQPAALAPGKPANGNILWRIPHTASADVGLRVRTRTGAVVGPWQMAVGPLTIEAPTAVGLRDFATRASGAQPHQAAEWALAAALTLAIWKIIQRTRRRGYR